MLLDLMRILPRRERRDLLRLAAWLGAAAILHGLALGAAGLAVAALLDTGSLTWLMALAVLATVFVVVQWIAQMIAFRVGSESARALHVRLGEHLAVLPLGWFTPTRQADVVTSASSGVTALMSYPALLLRPALSAVVTPVAAALVLALLDWRYPIAALLAVGIAWLVSGYSTRLAASVDSRRHQAAAEGTSRLLEYATRQHLIRTDTGPDDTGDLQQALARVRDTSLRSAGTVLPGLLLFSVTLNALFAALIALGVLGVAAGSLEVTAFIGALIVLTRLSAVAATGAELAAGLRMQRGALTRLAGILNSPPLLTGEGSEETRTGVVEVRKVSFRYGETLVLEDVSFTLPPRGLTALVGPSGAGKTSLIRLLARFWDPTSGSITRAGHDLRILTPEHLYAGLGTVLQEDYLLDATIGDNIRAGRPGASETEVAAAVEEAGLAQTIRDLPAGLSTPCGPGGSRLSGGQRQRVCIARALLKKAPLTLMDEATSALDPENRRLVIETAHRLARSGSVVLVAHDLESVTDADQILVIEGGRVVQRGTHRELAEHEGLYQRLLNDQARVTGRTSGDSSLPGADDHEVSPQY
ncbi:ABC transporter ATP-binding protein [Kineosporia mesophila]|uniref:ABC transporter ATP-binding protein n=1 Tax=Kineosporia mesophila TaxID=566012 RepID=A0ABP6ZBA3_9ACTN|nr:ABC transporter ATP-binding protein [Kineosporia mesophila]MCD5351936.1 ABC transporter ATP-binding protein/permease [Kineosporia mesophila]